MPVTDDERARITQLLRLDALNLPASLNVSDVDWEIVEDSSGEDSLEIVVVVDDDTTDEQIRKAPIHEIKNRIAESLISGGIQYFPYILFERKSEHVRTE